MYAEKTLHGWWCVNVSFPTRYELFIYVQNSKIAVPIVIGEEDILALYRASQKEILVLNLKRKISAVLLADVLFR